MTAGTAPGRFETGRVLARAYRIFRRRPLTLVALSVLFSGLPSLVTGYVNIHFSSGALSPTAPTDWRALVASFAIVESVAILAASCGYLLQAAATVCAIQVQTRSEDGLSATMSTVIRRAPILLLVGLVSQLGALVGELAFLVPGVLLALAWAVVAPVATLEPLGLVATLRRSAALTRGSRGAIFGIMLLYGLATVVFNLVLRGVAGVSLVDPAANTSTLLNFIINPVSLVIWGTVWAVVTAAIYFELRWLKEGVEAGGVAAVFD